MRIRHAVIALVAAALGVWVAVAAAAGGFGAGSSGTNGCSSVGDTVRCPFPPKGAHGTGGGAGGGGGGGGGGGSGIHHHVGTGARHHHGGSGEGSGGGGQGHGRPTNFTFSVRFGQSPASGASAVHGYSAHVLPPHGAPSSCAPPITRRPNIATRHQVARIHLKPPAGGWCDGHYRVTVTLNP